MKWCVTKFWISSGDIFLLGKPIKAHIVALLPGHALNAKLTRTIYQKMVEDLPASKRRKPAEKPQPQIVPGDQTELNVRQLLNLLPHRYPFLMVDRVVEIKEDNTEIKAIKNVTINEPYFSGHYPGRPIMPGVLQIEAMAQTAGVLVLMRCGSEGKVPLFVNCDKVKLRKVVTPGDQMLIEAQITKIRANKIGTAKATCKVDGNVVSSAELMFALMEEDDR